MCSGQRSCAYTELIETIVPKTSLICSGARSCQNVTNATLNGNNVYCLATLACANTTFWNVGDLWCGSGANGDESCRRMSVRRVKNLYMLGGENPGANTDRDNIVYSSYPGAGQFGNNTMNIYFTITLKL